jgi:hypothetical protein
MRNDSENTASQKPEVTPGLPANAEKTKRKPCSYHNHNVKTVNESSEDVANFKYSGITVKN